MSKKVLDFYELEKLLIESGVTSGDKRNNILKNVSLMNEQSHRWGMENVWNEAMYYLAETKRKTIPYKWFDKYYPEFDMEIHNQDIRKTK